MHIRKNVLKNAAAAVMAGCMLMQGISAYAVEDIWKENDKVNALNDKEDYQGAYDMAYTLWSDKEYGEDLNAKAALEADMGLSQNAIGNNFSATDWYDKSLGYYSGYSTQMPYYTYLAWQACKTNTSVGNYGETLRLTETALNSGQADENRMLNLYLQRGIALYKLGYPDEAVKYFNKIEGTDPLITYNNCAMAMSDAKRYDEAIKYYQKIADLGDDNYQKARYNIAIQMIKANKPLKDIEDIALEVFGQDMLDTYMATMLTDNGMPEESITYFERLLDSGTVDPSIVKYNMAIAYSKMDKADYDKVIECLNDAIANGGDDIKIKATALRASTKDTMGDFSGALEDYKEAESLSGSTGQYVRNISNVYLSMGNKADASKVLDNYISTGGDLKKEAVLAKLYLDKPSSEKDILDLLSKAPDFPEGAYGRALYIANNVTFNALSSDTNEVMYELITAGIQSTEGENHYESYPLNNALVKIAIAEGRYTSINFDGMKNANSEYSRDILERQLLIRRVSGSFEDECRLAARAVEAYPDYDSFKRSYIESLMATGQYDEAAAKIESLYADNADDTAPMSYRLYNAYHSGNYEDVIKYADEYNAKYSRAGMAYAMKYVAMNELGLDGADEVKAKALEYITDSRTSSWSIMEYSILGEFDKIKELLPDYLEAYDSTYVKDEMIHSPYMKNALTDADIAAMLGTEQIVIEEIANETAEDVAVVEEPKAADFSANALLHNSFATGLVTLVGAIVLIVGIESNKKRKRMMGFE